MNGSPFQAPHKILVLHRRSAKPSQPYPPRVAILAIRCLGISREWVMALGKKDVDRALTLSGLRQRKRKKRGRNLNGNKTYNNLLPNKVVLKAFHVPSTRQLLALTGRGTQWEQTGRGIHSHGKKDPKTQVKDLRFTVRLIRCHFNKDSLTSFLQVR